MWADETRPRYIRGQLRYPSDLTDDEGDVLRPLIAPAEHGGRRRSVDEREIMNGLLYTQ